LAVAGYAPTFDACARCGEGGPHRAFAPAAGGMVCADCRPAGVAVPAVETVQLLGALLSGDWTVADASEVRHRREATGMVSAYLQWHLERALRSLPHVERSGVPAQEVGPSALDGTPASTPPHGTGAASTHRNGDAAVRSG
jgi:DNA repair protein RecO (recombination protein O)